MKQVITKVSGYFQTTLYNIKHPFKPVEAKMQPWIGVVMWLALIMGYFLFALNWAIGSQLAHGAAFQSAFKLPTGFAQSAANWGITIGRAIGSILIGWLIVKITHKWAAIIGLLCLLISIPAIYSPQYSGFIILRTIFAIGATTLIILLQPVVAGYFSQRTKGIFSVLNPLGYNLGTIAAIAPFAAGPAVAEATRNDWKTVLLIIGLLALIPILIYILFAQRFDHFPTYIKKVHDHQVSIGVDPKEKFGVLSFFKKKSTWIWALIYGSWLVLVVISFTIGRVVIPKIAYHNNGIVNPAAIKEAEKLSGQWFSIWTILFLAGLIIGQFTIGLWPQIKARRKPYIMFCLFMAMVFFVLSLIVFVYMAVPGKGVWLFYIFGIIFGIFAWGIQGVLLNLPHEEKDANSRKIGVQFGLIWGMGYMFYTIMTIFFELVTSPLQPEVSKTVPFSHNVGWVIFFLIVSSLSIVGMALIAETRPEYPVLPKLKDFWIKKKKTKQQNQKQQVQLQNKK